MKADLIADWRARAGSFVEVAPPLSVVLSSSPIAATQRGYDITHHGETIVALHIGNLSKTMVSVCH